METKTSGIKLRIPGRPPAKSNSYRIVRVGGFSRLAPTKEVKDYERSVEEIARAYLTDLWTPFIPKPMTAELVVVWHRGDRRRKDLDNIAKSIKDGLTTGGVWSDDHQVTTLLLHAEYDAESVETEWVDLWITPKDPIPKKK